MQDNVERRISKKPLYLTLRLIQKFKEKYRIQKKNINLINSVMIFHGLSLDSNVTSQTPKRVPDIFVNTVVGCEGYSF